jgi:hypothetical protein
MTTRITDFNKITNNNSRKPTTLNATIISKTSQPISNEPIDYFGDDIELSSIQEIENNYQRLKHLDDTND